MEGVKVVLVNITFQERIFQERSLTEELLTFWRNLQQVAHTLVHMNKIAIGIMERHCHHVGLKNLHILVGHFLVALFFCQVICDILYCVYYVARYAVFTFQHSTAKEDAPARLITRSHIIVTLKRP